MVNKFTCKILQVGGGGVKGKRAGGGKRAKGGLEKSQRGTGKEPKWVQLFILVLIKTGAKRSDNF